MNSKQAAISVVGLALVTGAVLAGATAPVDPKPGVDWPSFRGIRGAGVAEGFPVPTTWNVPQNQGLRWKTPIPGLGHSSPIVWGGRVCVTTAISGKADAGLRLGLYGDIASVTDDTSHTWKLICVDKASGRVAIDQTIRTGVPIIKRHTKSTHANSTLATDGTAIVAMLGSEGLYAYEMDGRLRWKKDLGVLDSGFYMAPDAQWEFASSPVIHQGVVIIQADVQKDSFIAAFELKSGKELWRTPRADVPTFSTPTIVEVSGQTHVVVNGWRHTGAYDFRTGREIWKLNGGGDIPVPVPVVGHGLVFITNAHGPAAPVYAIRETATGDISLKTGETSNAHVAWTAPRDGAYMISPVLYDGLLYVSKNAGILNVLDAKTGERLYQQRIGNGTTGYTASLVAADGKVFMTNEDGDVHVIKAGRTYELLATNPLGDTGMATPAISEGVLYFRTGKFLMAVGASSGAPSADQQQHEHAAQPAERLGKVTFETSCSPAVRDDFNRGVAMLHSFWYGAAVDVFTSISKRDPSCAMAHWGVAMGIWGNPLGGTRTTETLARGRAAIFRGTIASNITTRERDYIAAVAALYAEPDSLPQPARAAAYELRMASLVVDHPKDPEAVVFYAIALVAAASPSDQTYAKQLRAAELLEYTFARQPDHPGVTHYLIHSYDYPKLAGKGLAAARRYASIAPDAPHALHMPSHIFTRVGAWQDSIDSNRASAAAAKKANSPPEELHAMDYQVYANLQLARDDEARRLLAETEAILARVDAGSGYGLVGFFGASAIPARVAIERGAWREAAQITVRPGQFPHTEAMTWFARALGAARSGQPAEARSNVARLAPLRDALRTANDQYWAGQVEIQRQAAEGWTLHAEGKTAEGLALLRAAADAEDRTEKSPITPGPLAPARELYAELLFETRQFSAALAEFEKGMTREPGRFRSLAGAWKAADAAGDRVKARKYANELLTLAKTASPGRADIEAARKIVG